MPNFNTKKEWITEARRLLDIGTSVEDIKNQVGNWTKDGADIRIQRKKDGIIPRNYANTKERNARRDAWEKVPDSNRQYFNSDEAFETYKKEVAKGKREVTDKTSLATKESPTGAKYQKGHITSAKEGGPSSKRNYRLENKRRNASHGSSSPPIAAVRNAGFSATWGDDAINAQNPIGLPSEYTPKDRLKILNAPPDKIDEVTAAVDKNRWDAIRANPNARPIRTNPAMRIVQKGKKWVPIVGALGALTDAGAAFAQGNNAEGVAHLAGGLVGEIPIAGDVLLESVAGSGLADGTLDANLSRVPKKGPVNTAAPTGDKKWDNSVQPFLQMLNGVTPTKPKPFKQTAIEAFNSD